MSQTHAVDVVPPRAGAMVAATLIGSALVHATVVEDHLGEWRPAGIFFLLLVAGETVIGVAGLRLWTRPLAWLVATSSIATVATWTLSRTRGMPVGPPDFRVPEAVGVPDLACCGLELAAAAVALWSLRGRHEQPADPPRAVVALVVLVAVAVTTAGTLPALQGAPDHHQHGAWAPRTLAASG